MFLFVCVFEIQGRISVLRTWDQERNKHKKKQLNLRRLPASKTVFFFFFVQFARVFRLKTLFYRGPPTTLWRRRRRVRRRYYRRRAPSCPSRRGIYRFAPVTTRGKNEIKKFKTNVFR